MAIKMSTHTIHALQHDDSSAQDDVQTEAQVDQPEAPITALIPVPPTSVIKVEEKVNDFSYIVGMPFDPTLSEEEQEERHKMETSYTGVTPRDSDAYIGKKLPIIGVALVHLRRTNSDPESEDFGTTKEWLDPLIKLELKDEFGESIVMKAGGKQGQEFVQDCCRRYGAGDWGKVRTMVIAQEARGTGKDGKPKRMYRYRII